MGTCRSRLCGSGGSKAPHQEMPDDVQLQEQLWQIRHKLLVMSGKGGVGKTTLAVYLALGLANRGYHVGLLDVDLHGPDTVRVLGIADRLEFDEDNYIIPHRYDAHLGGGLH